MIEMGFYDIAGNRFVEDREIITKLKLSLKIWQARGLGIADIKVNKHEELTQQFFYFIKLL
jgi:hypothetical protein